MNDLTQVAADVNQVKTLTGVFCATCEVEFASHSDHKAHYKSDFHQFNLKRKILQLPPLGEEIFHRSFNDMLNKAKLSQTPLAVSGKTECTACRKSFKSKETYLEHLKSKKHLENVKSPKPAPVPAEIKSITLDNSRVCLFCNAESESFEQFTNKESQPHEA
jgi:pre-60S factor REI1